MSIKAKEFGARLKEKFPEYANLDNTELARRTVAKYPEYKTQVDFGVSPAQSFRMGQSGSVPAKLLRAMNFLGEPGEVERTAKNLGAGVAGVAEGYGGMLEAVGYERMGKFYSKHGRRFREDLSPKDPKFSDAVVQGLGSSGTFLIPGFAVARGAGAMARVAPTVARWMGVGVSATMEAMVEGGQTFHSMIAKGKDKSAASVAAYKTFALNIPTIALTERFGQFSKLKGFSKVAASVPMEGLQEGLQKSVSNFAEGNKLTEGVLMDAAVGSVVGGISGGGIAMTESVLDQYRAGAVDRAIARAGARPAVTKQEAAARTMVNPQARKELPNLTPALTEVADTTGIPARSVEGMREDIRKARNILPGDPVTTQDVNAAIDEGVVPMDSAMRLDREIFQEEWGQRGLPPQEMLKGYQEMQDAVMTPEPIIDAMAHEDQQADVSEMEQIAVENDATDQIAAEAAPKKGQEPVVPAQDRATPEAVQDKPTSPRKIELTEAAKRFGGIPVDQLQRLDPVTNRPYYELTSEQFEESMTQEFEDMGEDAPPSESMQQARGILVHQALRKGLPVPPEIAAEFPGALTPEAEAARPQEQKEKIAKALPKHAEAAKLTREQYRKDVGGNMTPELADFQHEVSVRLAQATGQKIPLKVRQEYGHLMPKEKAEFKPHKNSLLTQAGVNLNQVSAATQIITVPVEDLNAEMAAAVQDEAQTFRADILAGTPGERVFLEQVEAGGTPEVLGVPSTYPAEYSALVNEDKLGGDAIINALDKIIAGEGDVGKTAEAVKSKLVDRINTFSEEAIEAQARAEVAGGVSEADLARIKENAAEAKQILAMVNGEKSPLAIGTPDSIEKRMTVAEPEVSYGAFEATLSPEDRALIQGARDALAEGTSTAKQFKDPKTGKYEASRAALHEQIVERIDNKKALPKTGQQPEVVIVIGPPASGKNTLLRKNFAKHIETSVLIDNDEMKAMLPEYDGRVAGLFHDESSDIETEVFRQRVSERKNITWAALGKNANKIKASMQGFKKRGYRVSLVLVDLNPMESAKRSVSRFKEAEARFVDPLLIIEDVGLKPQETYAKLKMEADDYARFSSEVPFGQPHRFGEAKEGSPLLERGGYRGVGGIEGYQPGEVVSPDLLREEADIAFGPGNASVVMDAVARDIEQLKFNFDKKTLPPSSVSIELRAHGKFDYRGMSVRNSRQAAEIVAPGRDGRIENIQYVLAREGRVVENRIVSSGLPDMGVLSRGLKAEMEALANSLGADSIYVAHNHPSGDPDPSIADRLSTQELRDIHGDKFKGHLVLDDVEFSLINPDGRVQKQQYLSPKPALIPARVEMNEPSLIAQGIKDKIKDGKSVGIVFLDSKLRCISMEVIDEGADLSEYVEIRTRAHAATHFVVAQREGVPFRLEKTPFVKFRLLDVLIIGKDGSYNSLRESIPDTFTLDKQSVRPEDILPKGGFYDVAEDAAEYGPKRDQVVLSDGKRMSLGKLKSILQRDGKIKLVQRAGNVFATQPGKPELWVGTILPGKTTPGIGGKNIKKQILQSVGLGPGQKVTAKESQLLKIRLRAMGTAAKQAAHKTRIATRKTMLEQFKQKFSAFKDSSRIARDEAIGRLKEKAVDVEQTKKMIVGYIESVLPMPKRGKYLNLVATVKSQRQAAHAFARVDDFVEKEYRKDLILDIRKRAERIVDSPSVGVAYKERVRDLVKDIELQKHTSRLMNKLSVIQADINQRRQNGEDVEVPQEIADRLKILTRTPALDLHTGVLENLAFQLDSIERLGRIAEWGRREAFEAEKEMLKAELAAGTVAIEKHPKIQAAIGERLGVMDSLRNLVARARDAMQHIDLAISPMDVVFDILDGVAGYKGANSTLFKKRLDGAFWNYLDQKDDWILPIQDQAVKLGMNDQNFERIAIHAYRMQPNGKDYLNNQGILDDQINGLVLTPNEQTMYDAMRETIELPYAATRRSLRDIYNREIGKIENYFPIQTDFDKTSEVEVFKRLGDSFDAFGRPIKSVQQGFTKARVGGKQAIKLNAMDVFVSHMDDVAYFNSTQRDIKMLFEVANSKEYGAAAGEVGQRVVLQWLDVMARKGGAAGAQQIAVLDGLRRNFGAAVLGFKLSSALIQPTALFDASAKIGGGYVTLGMKRVATSKQWREFLNKNIPELRHRGADDPAYLEFSPNKFMAYYQQKGFAALQMLDIWAASASVAGAYQKSLDERGVEMDFNNPDPEAVAEASLMLRRTQTSAFFKDLSLALSRGGLTGNRSFDKALFQFKSFLLNRWSVIRHDAWRAGIRGGKPGDAAQIFAYLSMATLAEVGIRDLAREIEVGALASVGLVVKEGIRDWDEDKELEQKFMREMLGNVPFLGDAVSIGIFGGAPIPAFRSAKSAFGGARQAMFGKDGKSKARGLVRAIEGVGAAAGIPGTFQASRLLRMALADHRLRNPYGKEMRMLKAKDKEDGLTDAEADRLKAFKDFDRRVYRSINKEFRAAMKEDDWDTARKVAEELTAEIKTFKKELSQ